MLSVIFTCLYRGTNIIFFLPPESAGLNFIEYLLQFIYFNYGITTQTKTTEFSFDPAYTGRIIELLYLNNLVDATEFLVNSETLNEFTLRKSNCLCKNNSICSISVGPTLSHILLKSLIANVLAELLILYFLY